MIEIAKECPFNTLSAEKLSSRYMTAITDKTLEDKLMKEKTLRKTIELNQQIA